MSRLLRIAWRWSLLVLLLLAVAAGCEDLVLRFRLHHGAGRAVVDQVTVYDAAEQKGGRVEIYFDHPLARDCVHALFPHFGYPPCWYAGRRSIELISRNREAGGAACLARRLAPRSEKARPSA